LEGNDILEKVNVSILDMRDRVTTVLNDLTNTFKSFTESLKEQQAALINALSLAPNNDASGDPTETPDSEPNSDPEAKKTTFDLGLAGKALLYGLSIAAGAIIGWAKTAIPVIKAIANSFKSLFNFVTRNKFAILWTKLSTQISGIITSLRTAFTDVITKSVAAIKNVFSVTGESKFGQVILAIKNGIAKLISPFVNAIKTINSVTGIAGKIGSILGKIGRTILKFAGSFGNIARIAGRIFYPITIIMTAFSTIKEAIDGFATGGILGGIKGAITGFFTSLITIPLDLIKDMVAWLLEKMGFSNAAETLNSFSFTELFRQMVDAVFGVVQGAIDWLKLLFTNPAEALKGLFEAYVGVYASIGAFIYDMAIKPAIDWVRGLFGFDPTTMTGEEGIGFISDIVSDAWTSVTKWFTDSLAGITDALPSWEDITSSIISRLPSWMIPDSFKTPEMITSELKAKIAENQGIISQIDSGQGGNNYFVKDSVERSRAAEEMAAQQKQLAEAESQKLSKNGAVGSVNIDKSSNPTYYGGAPASMILGMPGQLGGERPDKK
jgi:hypothetical protein